MKKITCLLPLILLSVFINAQQLYMPRNIKKAYENGTRSADGRPGKNYWQNAGKYDISFQADPHTRIISGTEKITYHNNSSDSLKVLLIRFVNNMHKPQAPRTNYVSNDFLAPGLVIESFIVNKEIYHVDSRGWGTVGVVPLHAPVLPKDTVNIVIQWHYELSKQSGREGMIDSTTIYAAYAYPRITVYDDYNGWDWLPHTDRTEFYNDFNDYTFEVKAPANYIVWATGDLLSPDEVLQPAVSATLKKTYMSDEVTRMASADDILSGKITQQQTWNSWKFSAMNITDICFALSNHYAWDAGSVVVEDGNNKRRVSVQAAYMDTAADFHHSVEWARYALHYFSTQWPGIAYPFSKMTAVQGFADMEYPMMVNDETAGSEFAFARLVQDHEIAHTYFPFYMGINETRYAYMDEGWATTFEYLINIEEQGKAAADEFYKNFRVKKWIEDNSTEEDQPVITMSTQVSGSGYGNNSYGKASLSYLALKDLLGDQLFKACLHEYMRRWHGKHPIPWDFFYSFNDASKQNLNWFWNNWFFSNNYIDLAIAKVDKTAAGYNVVIKNNGGFAIPFDVIVEYTNGKKETLRQTPLVWKADQKSTGVKILRNTPIRSVTIDGGIFMDANEKDNSYKAGTK